MLNTRGLYHATPAVTWDLGLCRLPHSVTFYNKQESPRTYSSLDPYGAGNHLLFYCPVCLIFDPKLIKIIYALSVVPKCKTVTQGEKDDTLVPGNH
jgi:hypothetical protein